MKSYPASHFQNRLFSQNMRRTYEEERETRLPTETEREERCLAHLLLREQQEYRLSFA